MARSGTSTNVTVEEVSSSGNTNLPSKRSKDIKWAFQPLFLWMRLLGIAPFSHLDTISKPRRSIPYLKVLFGLVYRGTALVLTILSQVYSITLMVLESNKSGFLSTMSYPSTWNFLSEYANLCIHAVVIHSLILFVVCRRWTKLMNLLKKHQTAKKSKELCNFQNSYNGLLRYRKQCIFGLIYIIIIVRYKCF